MVYYAVNKPKGYVSTNSDPSGRPRVVDLLPEIPERVYTVGRLDEDSTGLLILTNDGELANRLAHPRYGVEKLYRALVAGLPTREMLAKLTEGVWLSDGKVRAKRARIVGRQGQATMLELVLAEGKKREIRRMLSKLGHKVMSLNRVAVGPDQPQGARRSANAARCRDTRSSCSARWPPASRSRSLGSSTAARPEPSRDSHRPRKAEQARSASDEDGSPRRRPPRPSRDARQPRPAHGDSGRGRPPRPRPTAEPIAGHPRRHGRTTVRRDAGRLSAHWARRQTNQPQADASRGRPPRPRPTTAALRTAHFIRAATRSEATARRSSPRPTGNAVRHQRRIIGWNRLEPAGEQAARDHRQAKPEPPPVRAPAAGRGWRETELIPGCRSALRAGDE